MAPVCRYCRAGQHPHTSRFDYSDALEVIEALIAHYQHFTFHCDDGVVTLGSDKPLPKDAIMRS